MLVVEDLKTREIYRFLVVDGCMQLGVVSLNSHEKTFDPDRALAYVSRVEGQLLSLVANYKHSYRYLPRRAYAHLKKPPFLARLCGGPAGARDTEWFVDQFSVKPLLSVGGLDLSRRNQEKSSRMVRELTRDGQYGGRFFRIQETRERGSQEGFTSSVRANEIAQTMEGAYRNDILRLVKRGRAILIQLDESDELDEVLKWLILLKDAKLGTPAVILHVLDHKKWADKIEKLVEIPNSRILTAGATIVSLSSLIRALKTKLGNRWSERIIFGTNYPETNVGDGIPEILSYLLSKNLDASPEDIQRMLSGNILSVIPLRPPHLKYQDREGGVVAEGHLGRPAMQELQRVIKILTSSRDYRLESFNYLYDEESGTVDTSTYVLTLLDEQAKSGTTLIVRENPNSSLEICTWSPRFDVADVSEDPNALRTLVKSHSRTSSIVFDSPIQLNAYVTALTKCLNVRRPQELLAALRYRLDTGDVPRGYLRLADVNIDALGRTADNLLAQSQRKGQWWVARSLPGHDIAPRTAVISDDDRRGLGLESGEEIDLTEYQENITKVDRAIFVTRAQENVDPGEMSSYLHLQSNQTEETIRPLLLGRGSKVYPFTTRESLSLELIRTNPPIKTGETADLTKAEIVVTQPEFLLDVDVIICIALSRQMTVKDLRIEAPYSVSLKLKDILQGLGSYSDLLDISEAYTSRFQGAVVSALLILGSLEENRSEGRLGLCIAGERLRKFSIQHGQDIQDFVDFDRDLESPEVKTALKLFVLDALQEEKSDQAIANSYRAIGEYTDDFGMSRPTLAILIGDSGDTSDDAAQGFIDVLPSQCFELLRLETRSSVDSPRTANRSTVSLDALSVQKLVEELASALRRLDRGQSSSR